MSDFAIRSSRIREDLQALYQEVRKDLQVAHLQTVAFGPGVELTEDALQRWRRGQTKNPGTVHLLQVATFLGYKIAWENDLATIYEEVA